MTVDDVIRRGRAAEYLLSDDTLSAAFEDIAVDNLAAWKATAPCSTSVREVAYYNDRALELLKGRLMAWLEAAQMAARNIEVAERREKMRGSA